MAFSDQFLEDLRARAGLADVIGRRVKLTKKGREHMGLCPFHKEKTPSFTVNEDKGFYHCFGCGEHGSVFDFVMKTEGLNFPETVEKLAGEAGMEIPQDSPEQRQRNEQRQTLYDVTEKAARFFQSKLHGPAGRQALDYLKGRCLTDETIKRFRLGFAPDGRGVLKEALGRENIDEARMIATGMLIKPDDESKDSYDRFRGRVMFPITDARDRIIAFGGRILGDGEPKYLNSPETVLFSKGRVLYGMKAASGPARKQGSIIVTEGYTDVIALHQAEFNNAVAPLGTALTEDQIRLLWKIVPEPVLCFDGDAAGQKAAARAAERALPLLASGYGLRFALLPDGEDPDSLIKTGGAAAMASVLDAALPLSEVLWRMETGGRIPKTPEQRAALQKRLKEYANQITDSTLRGHFSAQFNDRVWAGAKGRGKAGGRDSAQTADWAPSMELGEDLGAGLTADMGAPPDSPPARPTGAVGDHYQSSGNLRRRRGDARPIQLRRRPPRPVAPGIDLGAGQKHRTGIRRRQGRAAPTRLCGKPRRAVPRSVDPLQPHPQGRCPGRKIPPVVERKRRPFAEPGKRAGGRKNQGSRGYRHRRRGLGTAKSASTGDHARPPGLI